MLYEATHFKKTITIIYKSLGYISVKIIIYRKGYFKINHNPKAEPVKERCIYISE